MKGGIKIFDQKKVRTVWDEETEEWYFSVIDVVEILTDTDRPRKYWSDLKKKLQKEGSELSEKIGQLKMPSSDGKYYKTDEWKSRGLEEGVQFATLTDIIYKTWADKTAKEYKQFKGLKKENLRDNMTNTELVLNMLAELSTKRISETTNPESFEEHSQVAKQGGEIARNARLELEAKTGEEVISPLNAKKGILKNKNKDID